MTVIFLLIIKYSKQSFYTLFILQFLLAAAYAVTDIPLGVATLMCTLFAVVLLFAYGMHEKLTGRKVVMVCLCFSDMGSLLHIRDS